MKKIIIRNINDQDLYEVQWICKKAFWNLNMPGCDEHYLLSKLWKDPSCIKDLCLLAMCDNKIVGAIIYAKALIKTIDKEIETLTFGPLCVDIDYQKQGIGKKLINESMKKAIDMGYKSIFICGVPTYYPKLGFKSADNFNVTMPDGSNFDAFMAIELIKGSLDNISGKYYEPSVYECDIHDEKYMKELEEFDKQFPYLEKKVLPHQWR